MSERFLLHSRTAEELYHVYAENMPVIDYHSHLPPQQIAEDHQFENLTQIWLYGDHYKWRAMRANGVPERYCTGDASDWQKFAKWAETVPKTLRSPLYHWTHMELRRPFGISDRLLDPTTAEGIWRECNAMLKQEAFSCRSLLLRMNVVLVCTTDDPCDSLEHHRAIAEDESFPIRVLPTFRPDKALAVDLAEDFNAWVDRLGECSDTEIGDYGSFVGALRKRHGFFHEMGCRLSDHGVETISASEFTEKQVRRIFRKIREGTDLDGRERREFRSAVLHELALMDHEKDWVQQFHMGALRNANTRCFRALGPDTGFDTIGDFEIARPLARFLDRLDRTGSLAKTILYNLNPRDNELLAAMIGNFQDGSVPGKMQYGSAWWFLDQKDGIEAQLRALSNMGLLSRFVGMLTDSRSFLSYSRHEYFRRVLCNLLGDDMEKGLLPDDKNLVGSMVRDICYSNALKYLGFEAQLPPHPDMRGLDDGRIQQ